MTTGSVIPAVATGDSSLWNNQQIPPISNWSLEHPTGLCIFLVYSGKCLQSL
ncbi:hypothetical protein SCLCIDRAFT_25872 [Scleroderma citrinum Foug A]|uniref:Uncharacterized protein n=1 Tax=Scleroderma citrinum Foug A TaxID=1036808 RepID=A0A0C3DZU1_9AGAM|nr:hypothetical protein SCLCIDRAFT_25872 [Scleroderma citrinum Foug A]